MGGTAQTLVTGATGFVGSAVARKLSLEGTAVRALVRPGSPRFHLDGLDLEFVEGDMRDAQSVRARHGRRPARVSCRGRLPAVGARSQRDLCRQCGGHAHVMQEALRAGVERIVYTSSVATLGAARRRQPGRRKRPVVGRGGRSAPISAARSPPSGWSRPWSAATGCPPSSSIPRRRSDPRDVKPTPTGRIIVEAARGRMPGFVDTGLNFVHVDDVAEGHLRGVETRRDRRALHPRRRERGARRHAGRSRAPGRPPRRRGCASRAPS